MTLSTWLGGLGTGSVALALSGLGAWYFLLPPRVSFQVQDPQDIVRFVFFLSVSTIAMVVTESRRKLLREVTQQRDALAKEVTERRQAEAALRESEARYRTFFEESPIPITVIDAETLQYLTVNDAAVTQYGYSRDEFLRMTVLDIRPHEDRDRVLKALGEAAGQRVRQCGVWRHLKRDGTLIFVDIILHALTFEDRRAWLAVCQDVTEHVKGYQALQAVVDRLSEEVKQRREDVESKQAQLQAATVELSVAEDRERKRLAQAVHENLAQLLLFSKMKLERIQHKKDLKESWHALMDVKRLLDHALDSARNLIVELRPPLLGDADDLSAALTWVAEKMRGHGLTVTVSEYGEPRVIDTNVVIIAYQAVQELLWNVMKHAGTQEAMVTVDRSPDHIDLSVEDYGKGFDSSVTGVPGKAGGFGLPSVRSRVSSIGGQVDVTSVLQHGTQVRLRMPLSLQQGRAAQVVR